MKKETKILIAVLVVVFLSMMGLAGYLYSKIATDTKSTTGKINTGSKETKEFPEPVITESQGNQSTVDLPSPKVSSPVQDTKISSPLTVKGEVPPGWMFEGVFPVKIVDSEGNLVAQGQGKEDIPGTWQSGQAVKFTAVIGFTTDAKVGSVRLESDNPSGDPSKGRTFIIPITF